MSTGRAIICDNFDQIPICQIDITRQRLLDHVIMAHSADICRFDSRSWCLTDKVGQHGLLLTLDLDQIVNSVKNLMHIPRRKNSARFLLTHLLDFTISVSVTTSIILNITLYSGMQEPAVNLAQPPRMTDPSSRVSFKDLNYNGKNLRRDGIWQPTSS